MKRILAAVLLVTTLLLSFVSCIEEKNGAQEEIRSKTLYDGYFNTVSTISSYKKISDEEFEQYVTISDETLKYYHRLFDIYHEYSGISNICTINKNAGVCAVKVDEELVIFLEYCKELFTITQGKVNIMLGSVLVKWHKTREIADEAGGEISPDLIPTDDALAEASLHTSIDSLIIDKEACTVFISDPDASIDVGAIGKGYAAEKLQKRLIDLGADSMALNIGGNICTIGLKPDGEQWVTGVTNPDPSSQDQFVCKIKLGETAIVTSGDYERFFISDGVKYHHIIDSETLAPATHFSSVSIITENSGLADALSTALFCMTYEDGLKLIQSIGGVEVIWVDTNYNVIMTEGVEVYTNNGK